MDQLKTTSTLASVPAPELPPNPKTHKRKIKVIVVGPNGGGVRKTKTVLVVGGIATAAGYRVVYVCGDRGIGSLSKSLKVGGPNRVEFLPGKETDTYADTLLSYAEEEDADIIIIDLGANEMLNGKSQRTILAALDALKMRGHETYVLLSLSPGKVALEDDAANYAMPMSKVATVILAFHGRDEGGDLGKFHELARDYPSIDVASDQLGVLGLISEAAVTPFEWCAAPQAGFELAAAWTANNLMQLAKQPVMVDLLGGDRAASVLADLAQRRPRHSYSGRNAKWQVRNEALLADAAEIVARSVLMSLPRDASDDAVIGKARAFIDASRAREAAYRLAKQAV